MEALQYPKMDQIQNERNDFVLIQHPLLEDKNIKRLGDYLKREGMDEEYRSYQKLMQDTDQIGILLDQLQHMTNAFEQERAAHEQTSQHLEEVSERMNRLEQTLAGMQKNMDSYEEASTSRFQERLSALANGFINLKSGIREQVNDLLLDFKVNGKAALGRISELLDVKGKLAWMHSCIQNGIYEVSKNIDRQNRMHAQYTKAAAALTQAENIRHEDRYAQIGDPVRLILQKREEMITNRMARMENRRDCLQNLCSHIADSIGRIEDFEKEAARAKQMRMADRLQAAEQEAEREEIRNVFER